jgi:predicted 3-demethylubiquinone-9 3-methyltransferase (glyoxalase superfamily)
MQKIVPCLWFNDNAEEAVKLYTSIFKKSKVGNIARFSDAGAKASGRPAGSVMTISFEIEGQKFLALNGGPIFQFTPAISLIVNCKTQKEIDRLWNKLSADPKSEQCGWLKDKFGISWQIVPKMLGKVMAGRDTKKAERIMKAILGMKKPNLKKLKEAARQ